MKFNERPLIIVDLETSGLIAGKHEILEIGAIRVNQQTLEDEGRLEHKISMQHPELAEPKALEVNGYRPEDWVSSIPLYTMMERFSRFAKDGALFSQCIAFEASFLKAAGEQTGYPLDSFMDYHYLDLSSINWFLNPKRESLSLKNICIELGIDPEPSIHRAINGAEKAVQILRKLRGL